MQKDLFNKEINRSEFSDEDSMKYQAVFNQELIEYLRLLYSRKQTIFIPGNTPSLKNNKEIQQVFTKLSACCFKHGAQLKKWQDDQWHCELCGKPEASNTRQLINKSKMCLK